MKERVKKAFEAREIYHKQVDSSLNRLKVHGEPALGMGCMEIIATVGLIETSIAVIGWKTFFAELFKK